MEGISHELVSELCFGPFWVLTAQPSQGELSSSQTHLKGEKESLRSRQAPKDPNLDSSSRLRGVSHAAPVPSSPESDSTNLASAEWSRSAWP